MTVTPKAVSVPSPVIFAEAPQASPHILTPVDTTFLPTSRILKSSPILFVSMVFALRFVSVSVLVSLSYTAAPSSTLAAPVLTRYGYFQLTPSEIAT